MLIEILVAIAILSIGLVILLQSLAGAIRANGSSANMAEAVLLGQQELWQAQKKNYLYGVTRGDFGELYPGFRWEATSKSTSENIDEVTIKIIWTERGQDKNLQLETLLARR